MRKRWAEPLGLWLLALIARGLYLLLVGPLLFEDGVHYAALARNLARGLGYTLMGAPHLRFPPAYPLAILAFSKLGLGFLGAGVLVSLLAGSLIPVLIYLFTRELFGRREALAAGALAALLWPLVLNSTTTHSEPLAHLLALSGLYLALKGYRGRAWLFLPAGLLLGGAYLTRPEDALLLLPGLALAFVSKRKLLSATGLTLGFVIVSSPYWAFVYKATGKLTSSGKLGYTLHEQEVVLGAPPERAGRVFGLAPGDTITYTQLLERQGYGLLDYVKENPKTYTKIVVRNAVKIVFFTLHPAGAGALPVLLAFLAIPLLWRRERRKLLFLLGLQIALLPYLLIVAPLRALTLPLLLLLPLAGLGFSRARKLGFAALGLAAAATVYELALWRGVSRRASWEALKAAAALVRSAGAKRLLVWESWPRVSKTKMRFLGLEPAPHYPVPLRFLAAFQAGAEAQGLPPVREPERLLKYMSHKKIDGILIFVDENPAGPPPIRELAEPGARLMGFKLVGITNTDPKALLWRKISP